MEIRYLDASQTDPCVDLQVAGCFCEHQETFLFLKRTHVEKQPGTWGVPAGGVDVGETVEEGAIRELFEETGIVCSDLSEVGRLYVSRNGVTFIFFMFHTMLNEKPHITLNDEHDDFVWVTLDAALQLSLIDGGKESVDCFKSWRENGFTK